MHQQPYPAYIPQQWPIPPLLNTNTNWPWFNSTMATPPQQPPGPSHGQAEGHWRAQNNMQNVPPHAQFQLGYHHAGTGQLQVDPGTGARVQIQHPAVPTHVQAPRPMVMAKPALPGGTNLNTPESAPNMQAVSECPAPSSASSAQPQLIEAPAEPLSATTISKRPSRRGQGNTCVTRGELCALEALARIFPGKVFEKVRPEWLINDRTKKALEIDLYNHELRLGLEHNGQSHYVFPNSLHKTREEFDSQVYRDKLKQSLSAKFGVLLIHVPFTVPHAAMETYIRSEIDRLSDDSQGAAVSVKA